MALLVVVIQQANNVSQRHKDQEKNDHKVNYIFHCLFNQNNKVRCVFEDSQPVKQSNPHCENIDGTD
tara:strand:+ start:156 stop:356 length:201 start_codon:yes stop_codon:yes gene_type:complete